MRIVIAGASGFVGKMLVARLSKNDVDLVLLGRDATSLAIMFPEHQSASYQGLQDSLRGADIFINLAVLNNDSVADYAEFYNINAVFSKRLAELAAFEGVPRFINVSSIHALDPMDTRSYATSKKAAVKMVDSVAFGITTHLYLPTVYGEKFSGSLFLFNFLPVRFVRLLLYPLSALKPIIHVDVLVRWILNGAKEASSEVILSAPNSKNFFYTVSSRFVDIFAAICGLILLSPLFILTYLMIRMHGDGPAVFVQERVGRHGKVFKCYKFRTMKVGTVQAGTHEVTGDAVTVLGSRLRSSKIDELPQLWNVLIGDMALIGPRPCLPSQKEIICKRTETGVLNIKPGISGLAQVCGIDMSDPSTLVKWDARYVAIRGLILDFKLILLTIRGVGRGDRLKS